MSPGPAAQKSLPEVTSLVIASALATTASSIAYDLVLTVLVLKVGNRKEVYRRL